MSHHYREPEDLLSDPSFLAYCAGGVSDGSIDWDEWRGESPEREALVTAAIGLLDMIRLTEHGPSARQIQKAEAGLLAKLDTLPNPVKTKKPFIIGRYRWIAAASVLVVLAVAVVFARWSLGRREEVKSGYGQLASRQLPDGTEVMMNANSRLTYAPSWQKDKDREVWVEGEAFFHVRPMGASSRFIVHTDHFDIIVTGTQFNVANRHGIDNVLLQEGSITLRTKDGRTLKMSPGDYVVYDPSKFAKSAGCKDMVMAWKEQRLVLDKTPLRQVAAMISDLYGTPVTLEGNAIGDRKISGILPTNNLDVLLKALEATGEYDVDHNGQHITIRVRPQNN